ncbi:Hypothetical protein D9617_8g049800 [Elsinoe fawcettii]|nr:Hypothetical protein D9617_8g049800 [Elsinoe fawcettii]
MLSNPVYAKFKHIEGKVLPKVFGADADRGWSVRKLLDNFRPNRRQARELVAALQTCTTLRSSIAYGWLDCVPESCLTKGFIRECWDIKDTFLRQCAVALCLGLRQSIDSGALQVLRETRLRYLEMLTEYEHRSLDHDTRENQLHRKAVTAWGNIKPNADPMTQLFVVGDISAAIVKISRRLFVERGVRAGFGLVLVAESEAKSTILKHFSLFQEVLDKLAFEDGVPTDSVSFGKAVVKILQNYHDPIMVKVMQGKQTITDLFPSYKTKEIAAAAAGLVREINEEFDKLPDTLLFIAELLKYRLTTLPGSSSREPDMDHAHLAAMLSKSAQEGLGTFFFRTYCSNCFDRLFTRFSDAKRWKVRQFCTVHCLAQEEGGNKGLQFLQGKAVEKQARLLAVENVRREEGLARRASLGRRGSLRRPGGLSRQPSVSRQELARRQEELVRRQSMA